MTDGQNYDSQDRASHGSVERCLGSGRPCTARSPDTIRLVTSSILFCPDLNPVDYAVWGNLQERVYKHQRITGVEELPACQGGMGPSGPGSD